MSEGLYAVNRTELWVKRLGSGEPVVVVHGGPVLEHGYLLPHLEPLAEDYELVFFDQRLSGRSAPEVDEGSVTLAHFVGDIEGVRRLIGRERIHLVGHSWGGLLAMLYAIERPDRLASLILLDSMAASAGLWQDEQTAVAGLVSDEDKAERQAIMATEAFAQKKPEAIEKLLELSFKVQFEDPAKLAELELYVPKDYATRSKRFGALGPELQSFDFHEELSGVNVPVLVLYGSAEPGGPLGGAAIHEALPDSEWVEIDGAGHFPFIEQPDAFLEAVRGFLDRVEGP
ncbi:MAG: alpha/beta fold hydrolase [Thermoanaerobaculia bacterium]